MFHKHFQKKKVFKSNFIKKFLESILYQKNNLFFFFQKVKKIPFENMTKRTFKKLSVKIKK